MINGKEVRPLQFLQAKLKFVPAAVSSRGKEVRMGLSKAPTLQALLKSVTPLVLINGKEVRLEQLYQANETDVPPEQSTVVSNVFKAVQPKNPPLALIFMLTGAGPTAISRVL